MTNNDFSFPLSAKDHILNLLPEGTIVFGGVLRDILDNKCVTDHFNDIDVLLPEEENIGDFVEKIINSINKQGFSTSDVEFNKKTNNRYHKDYYHYSLSFILNRNDGNNHVVSIDAIKAKNPTSEFISDFSVNSLYGVVTKKNNQKSIDIIGSICNQFTVDDIQNHINARTTDTIFKADVASKQRDWRTNKILGKGYSTNFHQGMYDFATAKSIVLDCAHYIAETLGKTKSTETSNNSSNKVNTNMSNLSFSDRFKANAIEGAYQGAAATAIQELANAFVAALKASGMDEVSVSMAEVFLKSDMGKAALSVLIGTSLPYIPFEALQNEHLQKIADKCVQNGTAAGFNTLATLAIGYVKPALEAGLNSFTNASVVPGIKVEQPKVRVEAPKAFDDMSEDEILAELEARRGKKNKVA